MSELPFVLLSYMFVDKAGHPEQSDIFTGHLYDYATFLKLLACH